MGIFNKPAPANKTAPTARKAVFTDNWQRFQIDLNKEPVVKSATTKTGGQFNVYTFFSPQGIVIELSSFQQEALDIMSEAYPGSIDSNNVISFEAKKYKVNATKEVVIFRHI
jgi:hypothetical protein